MEINELLKQRAVTPAVLRAIVRRIRDALDRHDERLDKHDAAIDAAAEVALRIRVVPALTDLPEDAQPTEWFRVTATPAAVYVGNGPGRPLSKFQTTAI